MTKDFICDGEKYETGGPNKDSIGLAVYPTGLPATIEAEGLTLKLRDSYHVTLFAVGNISKKHGVTTPNFLEQVLADFCAFVQKSPIELTSYSNEFRFMSEGEKRTVIVMCEVSNLEQFYNLMNEKYSLNLEYPPTHVTLYTADGKPGIFMVDSSDKEKLSKVIPAPVTL